MVARVGFRFGQHDALPVEPGALPPLAEAQHQLALRLLLLERGRHPVEKRREPVAGERGYGDDRILARGLGLDRRPRVGGEEVDLVPDLEERHVLRHAEVGEDRLDIGGLGLGLGMGDVADMQDQVGRQHLLQRGAEGGDKLRSAGPR